MNYEKMKNKELDRLAAEMAGIGFFHPDKWSPTSSDNNQVETYLFPKILKLLKPQSKGLYVESYLSANGTHNTVVWDRPIDGEILAQSTGVDNINKTKVIACLKARDMLREGQS